MFTIELNVGRLVEIRLVAPISMEDLVGLGEGLGAIFRRYPGKLVSAADATRSAVVPLDVGTKVVDVFRAGNPRIERSAILINHSATFGLQIERLVAEAKNPARRCFRDVFDMKTYLGSLLTHEEHGRLAQFLGQR
jgi:hypothetical protein